jgi:hypothetical protein
MAAVQRRGLTPSARTTLSTIELTDSSISSRECLPWAPGSETVMKFLACVEPEGNTGCSKSLFAEKPDIKTTYLLSIVLQKLFKMCARVLAPSPTPALTQKRVSTRLNDFQLGLQFETKQNYSLFLVRRRLEHTVHHRALKSQPDQ